MVFLSIRLERGGLSPLLPLLISPTTSSFLHDTFIYEFVLSLRVVKAAMSDTACQVIKCKAAISWETGKPLAIEEVEVAPPQANEGQKPAFPRIFDLEAAGVVESVGEGVTDLKPQDTVLPVFTGECKGCRHCKSEE